MHLPHQWWVGKGLDIPLNHPAWYPAQNLHNSLLPTSTMADLIDHNSCSWKLDLVKALYPYPWWSDILSIPISKTGSIPDKLVWKFSSNGDYKVHYAYKLQRILPIMPKPVLDPTVPPLKFGISYGWSKCPQRLVTLFGNSCMIVFPPSWP